MRQKHRVLRLKQEYILRQLQAVIDVFQSSLDDQREGKKTKAAHSQVKEANFAYSSGLTNQQSEWLERNGAIIREDKDKDIDQDNDSFAPY